MLLNGDCLKMLKRLPCESLDSMVTDPPAGISFMGKDWDSDKGGRDGWIAWLTEVMTECRRVLKPGAHALVWAIPRTSHWTMTALENAGFEIRDVVTHLFGTGFPKSLDVSKAIDKEAGAKRGSAYIPDLSNRTFSPGKCKAAGVDRSPGASLSEPPVTELARQWEGFGTALKPACEFWVLCRKPIAEKTVAKNVLKHGTGALNIDGCRIDGTYKWRASDSKAFGDTSFASGSFGDGPHVAGRFPSNLVLSHSEACILSYDDKHNVCSETCPRRLLDEQSGYSVSRAGNPNRGVKDASKAVTSFDAKKGVGQEHNDAGGASRFFYCAKASKSDRNRRAK